MREIKSLHTAKIDCSLLSLLTRRLEGDAIQSDHAFMPVKGAGMPFKTCNHTAPHQQSLGSWGIYIGTGHLCKCSVICN